MTQVSSANRVVEIRNIGKPSITGLTELGHERPHDEVRDKVPLQCDEFFCYVEIICRRGECCDIVTWITGVRRRGSPIPGRRRIYCRSSRSGTLFQYTRKPLKKDLEETDLHEVIRSCRSKKCGDKTEEAWSETRSIFKLLWKRFGRRYVTIGLITIAWTQMTSILRPYGMSRLISYFDKSQTRISRTDAYYGAGIVVFLNLASFIFWKNFRIIEANFAIRMQVSLMALLYRKILKLSPESLSANSLGNVVTILTKDIYTIESGSWIVMDLITFGLKTITVSYLLWTKLGNVAFIGMGILLLALPVQSYLSTFLTKMRLNVGEHADQRLQVMQETLSAIKIIKIYTWEKFFDRKVSSARRYQIHHNIKKTVTNVVIAIGLLTSKLTFLIVILAYIRMGYTTNTELLFYVLTLFNELNGSFGIMIPYYICKIAEFKASFIRLNTFLQNREAQAQEEPEDGNGKPSIELKDVGVKINDNEVLKEVNLHIKKPRIKSGYRICDLKVNGTVSYAAQEPWLFPSSVKQNILFGEEFEPKRYEEVIKACALKYDLSLMDNGDETLVADKGINLSKGQQLRVTLARAVYRKSDIYLLDDSLTALDNHVQDFIFNEAFKKLLSDKICLLVTQNVSHIRQAENVVILNEGSVVFAGAPSEIYENEINSSLEKQAAIKKSENNVNNKNKPKDNKENGIVQTEQQFSKKKVYQEVKKTGKVNFSVYTKYLRFGGGFVIFGLIILLFVVAQVCESLADKLITQWIDLQQKVLDLKDNSTVSQTYYEETSAKKDVSFTLYAVMVVLNAALNLIKYYALLVFCRKASVHLHQAMSLNIITAVMSFFDTHFIGNILNRFSLDLNIIDEYLPFIFPEFVSVVFSAIGCIVLISSINWTFLIPAFIFLVITMLLRMAYIPTGRSLKRVSAAAKSPVVGHINSTLEGLSTIRAFKAESILKDEFDRYQDIFSSAHLLYVYSQIAFGFFIDVFSCIFTILVIVRFLFFDHERAGCPKLDVLGLYLENEKQYHKTVCGLNLGHTKYFSAGNVGLALTQVFILTSNIEWAVRHWAFLENQMTSVERALEYTAIKSEKFDGKEVRNWPSEGRIVYEKVTLKYENAKDPVLKGISFSAEPGQKIGIVGRTGAGKSSILSTLFRLYDYEGRICIDGVDISTVSLTFLRKNIAIIPQDPVLFTGTIRSNIDPYKKHTDQTIWKAIEKVRIKHLIPNLEMEVKEGGSSFSVGQKQLICLARAAVRKFQIVVLDEATANMDPVTDKLLHTVIDDVFVKCTMLIIAHRLHTVIDCDRVMVLDNGRIMEFDSPKRLLKNKESRFYKMCQVSE
ncbi:hypothetical protein NQ317_001204 [Molorchus minor]|uniref:Uncharacterized protein n=1 Tax=Molorchus minor TaxID=1323400 RepID=A0ABQ9JNQ5_9CUCU|nr:hypothetical protein NQ317_001204 [Molorchus minor]